MIETNRLSGFGKQIDDRGAAKPKHFFIDGQMTWRPTIQQQQNIQALRHASRAEKLGQRPAAKPRKREIEEEVLFRKREVLLQQAVPGMSVSRIRQDLAVLSEPHGAD